MKQGDRVICIENDTLEAPAYLSYSKKIVMHTDLLISEKSILSSKIKNKKSNIFIPILVIDKVIKSVDGEKYLLFLNRKKTPKKYRIYFAHPAKNFRIVNEE